MFPQLIPLPPQNLRERATGAEPWAEDYQYPNYWTAKSFTNVTLQRSGIHSLSEESRVESFKKVILREIHTNWNMTRPTYIEGGNLWLLGFIAMLGLLRLLNYLSSR